MWDKKYSEELIARRQKAIYGGGLKRIEEATFSGKTYSKENVWKCSLMPIPLLR